MATISLSLLLDDYDDYYFSFLIITELLTTGTKAPKMIGLERILRDKGPII